MGFVLYRLLKSSGTLTQSMTLPVQKFIDWFLHLDQTLGVVIASQGPWTYGLLALIVFLETGVVVAPFLPGDSLLFAAGTFAGIGALSLWVLLPLLIASAIAGDTLNYWIGRKYGLKAYQRFQGRLLKPEYLERTQKFYRRHGSRMIVLARFVPVVRTLAPFVAGVGEMPYKTFIKYNVLGGVAWVGLLTMAGYYLGTVSIVRRHFSLVIIAIIVVSLVPMIYEAIQQQRAEKRGE
jgi:membrane-associated protein